MRPSRLLLPVVALAVLLAVAAVAWQWRISLEGAHDQCVVKVGLYENAPKVYTDANGRPARLFVELLDAIARDEGWPLRISRASGRAASSNWRVGRST